jgi:hypothetical protein
MTVQQQSLGAVLRQRQSNSLVADAEIIRDFHAGDERTHQAQMLIREALVQQVLGNIDQETQYRVNSILAFAMPEPDVVPDHD